MTDSGREPGDAEHHAELGRERAAVNAVPESTASELADKLLITYSHSHSQGLLHKEAAKELRRLADLVKLQEILITTNMQERERQQQARIAVLEFTNDQLLNEVDPKIGPLRARIDKLEAELTRRDEYLNEEIEQAGTSIIAFRLRRLSDDFKKIRNEPNPTTPAPAKREG